MQSKRRQLIAGHMTNESCCICFRDSLKIWNLKPPASVARFHGNIGQILRVISKEL